jgi:hypothetical protein
MAKKRIRNNPPKKWLAATEEDFEKVDLNEPVRGSNPSDWHSISSKYQAASDEAEKIGNDAASRVYAMICAICGFHFKPNDENEPFGPVMRTSEGRTPIPDDYRTKISVIIPYKNAFESIAVTARINDVIWLLDRKQVESAILAIDSYLLLVRHDGEQGPAALSYRRAEYLQRALQIASSLGSAGPNFAKVKRASTRLRKETITGGNSYSYMRFANLCLGYDLCRPSLIAAEAQALAQSEANLDARHMLWHVAARANRRAKQPEEEARCLVEAAECLVLISDQGTSAMYRAHWLERAIVELLQVPKSQNRRRALKHMLIDVQAQIPEELQSFSHSFDLRKVAEQVREGIKSKPFIAALGVFVNLHEPRKPEELKKEAEAEIAKHPLQHIFESTQLGSEGRPIHRVGGLDDHENVVQTAISRGLDLERKIVVNGRIGPARLVMMTSNFVSENYLQVLCAYSAFIPIGHDGVFANGLARFFQGDMIGALHILVPQFENSLRHVLRLNGHDVTKFNRDMTQEDLNMSVLLEKFEKELGEIIGANWVTAINHLFNLRSGPNLRNAVAHGHIKQGNAHNADSTYACWLILRMCCVPLFPLWKELQKLYLKEFGS